MSILCLNQRFLLILTESSMTVFLSINTPINNSNILAGILCRIWLTGFKCITTSSLLWPKWCLLKSEGESIKFILNKLQKGNQKKPSTIIMYLYCVKIYNLFFNKCVYNSIILLYTSCLLLKKEYSYGCHTYK